MRAGGEDQSVEVHRGPVVELEGVPVDVERAGAVSQAEVELERGDLLRRSKEHAIEPPRARQELLRERRTVVGQVGLGADQDDRAAMPLGAQGLGGAQARQGCTDDGDGRAVVTHHGRTRPYRRPAGMRSDGRPV